MDLSVSRRDFYGDFPTRMTDEHVRDVLVVEDWHHPSPPDSTLDYLLEQRLLMEFSMRGDLLLTSSVNRCFDKTWCVQPIGGVASSLEDSVFFNPRITLSRRKRMIVVIH